MDYIIRKVNETKDWLGITSVFNHFIKNDFSAYPDQVVKSNIFSDLRLAAPDFPFFVVENKKKIIGFGFLNPFHSAKTMEHTATVSYFILPPFTDQGIGSKLLNKLLISGKKLGINNFLAHISSLNHKSIHFHLKHGFRECGRFYAVGKKFGETFDMIWMQRIED
jgi:phosphinothricin acetyltransferase